MNLQEIDVKNQETSRNNQLKDDQGLGLLGENKMMFHVTTRMQCINDGF